MFSFPSTAFTDLMPWELAHLYVESWVISMEVAEGPLAACVGFFALVNPMSDAFTQSAYVVSLLHHSVIQRDTAKVISGMFFKHVLVSFNALGCVCLHITTHSKVMSVRILGYTRDLWPIEVLLEFVFTGKLKESAMDTQSDLHGFHSSFSGLKLDDQLTGFLIETLLELMHSIREFLYGVSELHVDWDMGNNRSELCHFCEHPWVLQFVQGLLQGKIEGDISDEEVEVMVIHIDFQWGL